MSRSDRGEVSIETVLVLPALLVDLLLALQAAISHHAGNVAAGAASRAASVAASSDRGDSASRGSSAAVDFVAASGGELASSPVVEVAVDVVRSRVSVSVPRLVPWVSGTVTRSVTEPIERFVPEVDR